MKLQSTNLLETLTANEIKMLTSEVKESVCTNFKTQKKRNFTAANLWDIQRRKRNLSSKRFAY
ncbi:MAG TPA: hypothetical protein VIJ75_07615 [Hanamia sp.]